jgi:hypothetical protein
LLVWQWYAGMVARVTSFETGFDVCGRQREVRWWMSDRDGQSFGTGTNRGIGEEKGSCVKGWSKKSEYREFLRVAVPPTLEQVQEKKVPLVEAKRRLFRCR